MASVAPIFTSIFVEIFERKLEIIDRMWPEDVNHFLPLLELKLTDLKSIAKQMEAERMFVPNGNRIYYFSTKLEVNINRLNQSEKKLQKFFPKNCS